MTRCICVLVAFLTAGCNIQIGEGETKRETQAIELGESKQARLNLELGAGELTVGGGAAQLLEAEFAYNADRLKPVVENRRGDSGSEISISQPSSVGFNIGNMHSAWNMRLNDGVAMDVTAKLGAGEAEMNLGSLDLRSLEVNIGAGEVHVDLRGTPKRSYSVRINGGVGETVVFLPRSVGISASAVGGLGEISVNGLERRGERWVNAGHEGDPVQINVDVKGGIGEIRVSAQ